MSLSKVNRLSKPNTDTGFGVLPNQVGERFVRKDGSYNLEKTGISFWQKVSIYSTILQWSWLKFITLIVLLYLGVNVLFTILYLFLGINQLTGLVFDDGFMRVSEVFFFSTQTFTTVGYGRINPVGFSADILASIEAMLGWMYFALVTGLLYGRFTKPQAFLQFSDKALIAPYQEGRGLMFRLVPYKNHHHLTDAKIVVNIVLLVNDNNKSEYKFYELKLERSRVDALSMNWTVVHPIDSESPILNLTEEDMRIADVELYVQVSGFDPIFSNSVMQRTSYTFDEFVWGAKFKPMYHISPNGITTVLEIDKLNDYDLVEVNYVNPILS